MHILPYLMTEEQKKLADLEAKAVDQAKATADASLPSAAVWKTAASLLQNVDGPSLDTYEGKESVYVGRKVPIAAGSKLEIPIQVSAPGSIVEYAVELNERDVDFGIEAEREEGVTVVRETSRIASTDSPVTQKFLVGSVPCTIQFTFSNEYSWMREKTVSYKVTVTPPSKESLTAGRRRRAHACLQAVKEDLTTAVTRLEAASKQKMALQEQVAQMMKDLAEKKKAWQVAEKEETWLLERKNLRIEQQKLLQERLDKGWPDEKKK